MNQYSIEELKNSITRRLDRINNVPNPQILYFLINQFWSFLIKNEITKIFLTTLEFNSEQLYTKVVDCLSIEITDSSVYIAKNEEDAKNFCYLVIRECMKSKDELFVIKFANKYRIDINRLRSQEAFISLFVQPFADYIFEYLDNKKITIHFLKKYKQKCEWFLRDQLYEIWNTQTLIGEKKLSLHLYEHLHDAGLVFFIEPQSTSGEIDLIALQPKDQMILADVKIFNPEKSHGTSYIAKGINQICTYAQNYNQETGYLIIFNTSEIQLFIESSIPFEGFNKISHNNKTIILIIIDICTQSRSASKIGKIKTHTIKKEQLQL